MRLRFTIGLIFLLGFTCTILLNNHKVLADGYDGSHLIDDSIFLNASSMSTSDIQNLLNNLGGGIAGMNFVFDCASTGSQSLQAYQSIGAPCGQSVSAATIIYYASQIYGINPGVVLSTIQKEQSLLTTPNPTSWQVNQAMGYACPDSGGCGTSNFLYQVDNGTWALRFHYERARGNMTYWRTSTSWTCGTQTNYYSPSLYPNQNVNFYDDSGVMYRTYYLQNPATSSLYCYTPHAYNNPQGLYGLPAFGSTGQYYSGSYNFVKYFSTWFGPTTGTFLLQSPSSPTVYVVTGTSRYTIPSYDVFLAYGFQNIKVTPVSDAYIQSLTDGGILNVTFTMSGGDGTVYLADNGYKFNFTSYQQCLDWGKPTCIDSAKPLPQFIFDKLLGGGPIKQLMLNGSTVYRMSSGTRQPFLSWKALEESGYSNNDITPITNRLNYGVPFGQAILENNSFVKFGSSSTIYFYSSGHFFGFNSFDTLLAWLPQGATVFQDTISSYSSQPPQVTSAMPQFVSLSSGKKYALAAGHKYDITAVSNDWPTQVDASSFSSNIDMLPTAATVDSNSTFRLSNGYMFRVMSGKQRPFYSVYDYFAAGYSNVNVISVPDYIISSLPVGSVIFADGGGSLYKTSTPGQESAIWVVNSNSSSCGLQSINQLAQFNLTGQAAVLDPSSQLAPAGALSSLVSGPNGNYYVVNGGIKYTASATLLTSAWGVTPNVKCGFSNGFLNRLSNSSLGQFGRSSYGTIYYAIGGQKHPLSWSRFVALGGNSTNTTDLPDDFLDMSPTGAPMY